MRFNKSRVAGVAGLLAAALAISACGSSGSSGGSGGSGGSSKTSGGQSLSQITIGCDNSFFGCMPFFVAQQEGFWQKNGLKVTYVPVTNTSAAEAALVSGSLNIALGPDAFVFKSKFNTPVQYVSGLSGQFFEIVASKSVNGESGTPQQRLAALKGHTIGVSGIDSSAYYGVLDGLKTVGLTADDVKFVNIQGLLTPELAALKAGSIDALMTDPVLAAALAGDSNTYVLANYATPGYLPSADQDIISGPVAETSWISSHGTQLKEYQKAFAEAVAWMQNPANFPAAQTIMKTVIGAGYSAAVIKSITTDEIDNVLKGYQDVTSVQHEYEADLSVKAITPIPGINFASYIAPGVPTSAAAAAALAKS